MKIYYCKLITSIISMSSLTSIYWRTDPITLTGYYNSVKGNTVTTIYLHHPPPPAGRVAGGDLVNTHWYRYLRNRNNWHSKITCWYGRFKPTQSIYADCPTWSIESYYIISESLHWLIISLYLRKFVFFL